MSSWVKEENDGDAEEEDEEDPFYKSVNDHIVFLIDARDDMFVKSTSTGGEQHFINSLKVALVVMKSKIIASEKDSVGIVFFGAESQQSSGEYPNVCNFIPLAPPSAEKILAVQELIENPASIFDKHLRRADTSASSTPDPLYCPLKEALMLCTQTFNVKSSSAVHANDFKRVWLFTTDDSPNSHKPSLQNFIVQVAKDSAETGVEISLWHMHSHASPDSHFDPKKFYEKLLLLDVDENLLGPGEEEGGADERLAGRMIGAGFDTFDDMIKQARRKEVKKRRLGSVRMQLSSGLGDADHQIALSIYKTVLPATRPAAIWLQASTSLPAKTSSCLIDTSTGQVVDPAALLPAGAPQLSTYIELGGARVPFSAEEMKACKTLRYPLSHEEGEGEGEGEGSSRLKVLFFTKAASLGLEMNLEASTFVFPDDTAVKGSVALFSAVASKMVESGLIGIGAFSRVKGAMPRLVAMIPRLEEAEEEGGGEEAAPAVCGMDLVTIPYASEVRDIAALKMGTTDVSREEVAAAEALVTALQFEDGFQYQSLENPVVQHVYGVLQAIALGQEESDWRADRDDKLQPDTEGIAAHTAVFQAFQLATGAEHCEVAGASAGGARGKKRAADGETGGGGGGAKKAKAGAGPGFLLADGSPNLLALKADNADELLMKETAATLKEVCKALKLPVTGTKPVLVTKILAAME